MITVRSAPTAARRLVKAAPYLRRQISQASHNEQNGRKGARSERETVTASFAKDAREVASLIAKTSRLGADLDRCAVLLASGTGSGRSGLVALAARCVRLGLPEARRRQLAILLEQTAQRAGDAADRAQDRLDRNDAELASVATLADLSARLPAVEFDPKHPSVRHLRREYLDACQVARKSRTER